MQVFYSPVFAKGFLCASDLPTDCVLDFLSQWSPSAGSATLNPGLAGFPSRLVGSAAAESVAVRGLMFSNKSPCSSKGMYMFHGPKSNLVRTASEENQAHIMKVLKCKVVCTTKCEFVLDILPFFRQLGHYVDLSGFMPSSWAQVHDKEVVRCNSWSSRNAIVSQSNMDNFNLSLDKKDEIIDSIED